jgi:tyrosyl-tRNA synthetase
MAISTDKKKIESLLTRGVSEVIDRKNLEKKLLSGKELRVKLGIDPTSPDLHLGRSVPLLKLRDFQELGHKIVFIVGDFTGVIGDTSDKESERPMLDKATVEKNMQSYREQAGKIIDLDRAEIRYNSEWLGKLSYYDVAEHANQFSLAEFIARENIRRRIDAGTRVSLREVLYPLMQGYDSVAVSADVEIGGTDQRFNLLAGRTLQQHFGQAPQDIIMNPLVAGTDGRKMSSSWGNTITFSMDPKEMYGKVMSISDDLIADYFEYFTRVPEEEIAEMRRAMKSGENPRDFKMKLAEALVDQYHGETGAKEAGEYFTKTFSNKQTPDEMPTVRPKSQNLVDVLLEAGMVSSKSEARRAIEQGGVRINDEKVEAVDAAIQPGDVIQKGKRHFVKIV